MGAAAGSGGAGRRPRVQRPAGGRSRSCQGPHPAFQPAQELAGGSRVVQRVYVHV
jgi:hypothetical protein